MGRRRCHLHVISILHYTDSVANFAPCQAGSIENTCFCQVVGSFCVKVNLTFSSVLKTACKTLIFGPHKVQPEVLMDEVRRRANFGEERISFIIISVQVAQPTLWVQVVKYDSSSNVYTFMQ